MLKTSFNVPSEDQGSHPDDLSIFVLINISAWHCLIFVSVQTLTVVMNIYQHWYAVTVFYWNTWATLNWYIIYIYIYLPFSVKHFWSTMSNVQIYLIAAGELQQPMSVITLGMGSSQSKMVLQCNVISYWLSPYPMTYDTGIFLCMRPANERRRYYVTSSLIGWAHTQWLVTSMLYVWCQLNIPSMGLTVSQFHIWDPSPNLSRVPVSLSGMYRSLVE